MMKLKQMQLFKDDLMGFAREFYLRHPEVKIEVSVHHNTQEPTLLQQNGEVEEWFSIKISGHSKGIPQHVRENPIHEERG